MKKLCYVISALFITLAWNGVQAQETDGGYNPNSLYPVHESYKMYKKVVWRRMDMKEKQNKPFFARNRELSTILINAVKDGLLFPYQNDSVTTRMSKETFLENLKLPDEGGGLTEEELAMGFGEEEEDDFFGDDSGDEEAGGEEIIATDEYESKDFSILEIKEEVYFDKIRSRMYYDIHAVTLLLPADLNPALFEKPLASFKFIDIIELFRSMPNEAVWYNVQNQAEHRNFADAFDLRLFSANLIKYANPDDDRIVDIYSKTRRDGILASQRLEYEMLDFENELWEF